MDYSKQMKKFLKAINKDNMKINNDSLSIRYNNIKHALLKSTRNHKKMYNHRKKVEKGDRKTLRKEDNPIRICC
jgi:uncharacterized membrane protein YgaE (UPF0421/DUF939 family)